MNGGLYQSKPPVTSTGGLFGSIKATVPSLPTSTFSFGSSSSSNPFAKVTPSTAAATPRTEKTTTPVNPFANVKASKSQPFAEYKSIGEPKSMFPPNSPFAKHPPPPAPTSFSFSEAQASEEVTPVPPTQSSSTPIRTAGRFQQIPGTSNETPQRAQPSTPIPKPS